MGRGKKTQVRFLGGCAARSDLLGVLAFPVGFGIVRELEARDIHHVIGKANRDVVVSDHTR